MIIKISEKVDFQRFFTGRQVVPCVFAQNRQKYFSWGTPNFWKINLDPSQATSFVGLRRNPAENPGVSGTPSYLHDLLKEDCSHANTMVVHQPDIKGNSGQKRESGLGQIPPQRTFCHALIKFIRTIPINS